MAKSSRPGAGSFKGQSPQTHQVFCGLPMRPFKLPERPGDVFDEPVLKEILSLFAHEQGVVRQAALKEIVKRW